MTRPGGSGGPILRVRHSRTGIGILLAVGSGLAGLAGLADPSLRSPSVEATYAAAAAGWYALLSVGAGFLTFALTSPQRRDADLPVGPWARRLLSPFTRPWADHVDDLTYPRITARLYADQVGHIAAGWAWTSYGIATVARQAAAGITLFVLASIIVGGYTAWRLRQLHLDTRGLRAWRARTRRAVDLEEG